MLIEDEFNNYITSTKHIYPDFNYSILKSNVNYDSVTYNKILKLYKEYSIKLQDYLQFVKKARIEQQDATVQKAIFKKVFQEEAYAICPNKYELCNIVLDICYSNIKSKQFAWDICGEVFIENLLKKNHGTIKYLVQDDNGDVEFCGEYFSEKYKIIDVESEDYV